MFAFRAVVPFAVTATVSGRDPGLLVSIANGTDRALRGCFLVSGGKGYPIGDLATGASTAKTVSSDDGIDLRARTAAASLCGDPRKAALWSKVAPETATAVVVGWLDGPVLSTEARGARRPADRAPLSLVTVKVP
jgi:hypothetical protein